MSSRGTYTKNGHVTTTEYSPSHTVENAVVLVGNNGNHGLPDYSHTPNRIYIKEYPDGNFQAMRIYDDKGKSVLEIANHYEPSIAGNHHIKVLHYHLIGDNFDRSPAIPITDELRKKYKKILGRYGL